MNQWKLTDLIVEKIIFTDESVKGQITDSISENLTDLDLESVFAEVRFKNKHNIFSIYV